MRNYDFQNSDFRDGFLGERIACVGVCWTIRDNNYFSWHTPSWFVPSSLKARDNACVKTKANVT